MDASQFVHPLVYYFCYQESIKRIQNWPSLFSYDCKSVQRNQATCTRGHISIALVISQKAV